MQDYYADPFKIQQAVSHLSPAKTQLVFDFASRAMDLAKKHKIPDNLWNMADDLGISQELNDIISSYTITTKEEYEIKLKKFEEINNHGECSKQIN
jgi:hypothetical protein